MERGVWERERERDHYAQSGSRRTVATAHPMSGRGTNGVARPVLPRTARVPTAAVLYE